MNNAADRPPSFFSRWGEALAFVGLAALSTAMYVGLAWLVITSSLTAYAQHDFVNLGIALWGVFCVALLLIATGYANSVSLPLELWREAFRLLRDGPTDHSS